MSLPCRIDELQRYAIAAFTESGSMSPSVDAAVLLCHVLEKPRSYLMTWPEKELSEKQLALFESLFKRRVRGEPIAYITGEREFWSLPLKVSPATLIPRPDTECLVEAALEKSTFIDGDILDLGTGTGAVALALASELPQRCVIGVDISSDAYRLAIENARRLAIKNATFYQSNWFERLTDGTKFALIVSNPPYIDEHDPHLKEGDVRFEPLSALVAQEDGLADIKMIATKARDYLLSGGWLLFEHGYQQAGSVQQILTALGYQQVFTQQDGSGNDRVTAGLWHH
ncbi:Release factor glutamine methyltransferase [Vibrio aerogenes CECT 7868]|uniref:Release factor glutamine methyltransferase n=1 Tax=Vibrio aerogenes CECT 7868 TaxID=1216006 RepID=A0A1M5W9W1_9VIBR|nr:peptide chain release factor N(5)-glutamine methyltransferase [Vibrio aerogenes]SHH84250.1 Release factor glutamine methyltransferase [Vibrio aerogenes CECT 7868]